MTPQKRLEEIEWQFDNSYARGSWETMGTDIGWLVQRIKHLEKALESLPELEIVCCDRMMNSSEVLSLARKALRGE